MPHPHQAGGPSRWPSFPPYPLPDELSAEDLVSVSIDSTQLTTVVSALMKTIHSQSQCIETLDKEARQRKAETEARLRELDVRFAAEIDRLTDEFREYVGQLRDESKRREAEDYKTRTDMATLKQDTDIRVAEVVGALHKNSEQFARELDQLASACSTLVKDETGKLAIVMRDELQKRDEVDTRLREDVKALATDVVKLRDYVSTISEENGKTLDQVHMLHQELRAQAADLDGERKRREDELQRFQDRLSVLLGDLDALRNHTNQLHGEQTHLQQLLAGLGQAVENNNKATFVVQSDVDSVLLFLSLTKNAVMQANKTGNQTEVILATPAFRKLINDVAASQTIRDRKLEEVLDTLQTHTAFINKKADADSLQQTQEILLQNISKGDQENRLIIDDIRRALIERLNELHDRLQLYTESSGGLKGDVDRLLRELAAVRQEQDVARLQRDELANILAAKADLDKVIELGRAADMLRDRLYDVDKAVDSAGYRLGVVEKELTTQAKSAVRRVELDAALTDMRAAAAGGVGGLPPPPPQATAYAAATGAGGMAAELSTPRPPASSPPRGAVERREVVSDLRYTESVSRRGAAPLGPTPGIDRDLMEQRAREDALYEQRLLDARRELAAVGDRRELLLLSGLGVGERERDVVEMRRSLSQLRTTSPSTTHRPSPGAPSATAGGSSASSAFPSPRSGLPPAPSGTASAAAPGTRTQTVVESKTTVVEAPRRVPPSSGIGGHLPPYP